MHADKSFEILSTSFSTIKNGFSKEVAIIYALRRPAIHLTITGDMAAGICEFLNLILDQATRAGNFTVTTVATNQDRTRSCFKAEGHSSRQPQEKDCVSKKLTIIDGALAG